MSNVVEDKWDRVFSTNREFREDWSRSYVDQKRDIGGAGEGIEIFLEDYEDSGFADKAEELKAFAGPVTLRDLEGGVEPAGLNNRAWLDERSISGEKRDHKNPFTARQLYRRRQVPRIGAKGASNSDRCLTYIKNLDPSYMLALAETALDHEVLLLRDAIWKHYARKISLKVTIPYRGFKIFQLEFHLQYFKFGPAPTDDQGITAKALSNWTDLSFLEEANNSSATGTRRCGMSEGHFSFVIYGISERRWGAYAFDDTEPDEEDLQDKISCGGRHWDPIGSCLEDDIDAELPIWNPREYFLNVVARRVALGANYWEGLLRAIERRIKNHNKNHPSTLSGGKRDRDETVKTFDWTRQTIELVNRLQVDLSETNEQWERFKVNGGDVDYFSDSISSADIACKSNYLIPDDNSQNRLEPLLCEIGEQFQRLQTVQRTLDALSASCKDSANALQLRLSLESNEHAQVQLRLAAASHEHAQLHLQHAQLHLRLAEQSNEAMKTNSASTDFQIFILVPIAVAAAILQYSPNFLPLPAAPAVIILTAVFIVTIKLLHAIFRRLPGVGQCWEHAKAAVKAMKLKASAGTIIGDNSSSC